MRSVGLLAGMTVIVGAYGCAFHLGMSGGKSVAGSGVAKTESRSVADFDSVNLSGMGKVIIRQSDKETLSVSADDNLLPLLQSKVINGTLQLDVAPGVDLKPTRTVEFDIDVKKLTNITVSGAGDIQANDINGKELAVSLSGAGNVALSGQVTDVRLTLAGAGNVDAAGLKAHQATVDSSGVGHAVVNASDKLNVNLSGIGSVEYIGTPQLEKNISGIGKVTQRR